MKKKKKLFIVVALILTIYIVYKGYERWPSRNWKEYRSLVGIWPRLKKEKIEDIYFTQALNLKTGPEDETTFQTLIEILGFRQRDENVVSAWVPGFSVPKKYLSECIIIIDKAIKHAKRPWWLGGEYAPVDSVQKMLITTKKGKYIFHIRTDVFDTSGPKVCGEEWCSYELGKFLAKYCFPNREFNFKKYDLPSKEQTVAILLYPIKFPPPLALFGDKKLAEKLLFEKEFKEPNGVKGIAGLYKLTRLRTFGVESKKENGKIVISNELKPKKIFEGRAWLEKIIDAYETALKEADEREEYFPSALDHPVGRIVFMTQEKDYWKEIGIDANTVYDDYIKSEQLKTYFDELGITKDLLAGQPGQVGLFDGPSDMSIALGMHEPSRSRVYQGWYDKALSGPFPPPINETEYQRWSRIEWYQLEDGANLYDALYYVIGQQYYFGPLDPVNCYRLKGEGDITNLYLRSW